MNSSRLPVIQRLWTELVALDPENDVFLEVMRDIECLSVLAGRKVLGNNPTNVQLCCIIEYVPVLRVEAAQKLFQKHPTVEELRHIMKYVESLRGEAKRRLPKRKIEDVLRDIGSTLTGRLQAPNA